MSDEQVVVMFGRNPRRDVLMKEPDTFDAFG